MRAAVPSYVGQSFGEAPPGHRFRLYFPGWNASSDWEMGKEKAEAISQCTALPDRSLLTALLERQQALAERAGALRLSAELAAPLATGLGNPHPVENGLAFSDPHGLPYLPGSSVKGTVRAAAESMALDGRSGWSLPAVWWIFGFDGTSAWHESKACEARERYVVALKQTPVDRLEIFAKYLDPLPAKELRASPVDWFERARAKDLPHVRGALVLWDVYPDIQRLDVDIMTPHHGKYYQGDRPAAPIDCEEPTPIPFLVVPRGAEVRFAIQCRPAAAVPDWVRESWRSLTEAALHEALERRGFGAKTVQGFGASTPRDSSDLRHVEIVTPAFIGGSDPLQRAHTTLRTSTLRGKLRWWWRAMHVGFLDTQELRDIEDALWGSVRTGKSPVTVRVVPDGAENVLQAPYKQQDRDGKMRSNREFLAKHGIEDERDGTGIAYAAYGMADRPDQHRFAIAPGTKYLVELSAARGVDVDGHTLTAEQIQGQALAAWKLLCSCGALGAKSRHGFGSISDPTAAGATPAQAVDAGLAAGKEIRSALGFGDREYDTHRAGGALGLGALATQPICIDLPSSDPWQAMDAVGRAMKAVAKEWKHKERKVVLGLPRKIHGPIDRPIGRQRNETHEQPVQLRGSPPVSDRHASPVQISLSKLEGGRMRVSILAFVASKLPDAKSSEQTLTEYVRTLKKQLEQTPAPQAPRQQRGGHHGGGGRQQDRGSHQRGGQAYPVTRTTTISTGQPREVILVGRTKKGKWNGSFEEGGATYRGPILGDEPSDLSEGQRVMVIVGSVTETGASPRNAQFTWKK